MEIKSRVPGKIVRFEKQVGDSVEVKDVLIVMEAMKMKQKCELFPPRRAAQSRLTGAGQVRYNGAQKAPARNGGAEL